MKITIFGGSGFVGRELVQKLLGAGHTVRVVARQKPTQPFACEVVISDPYDPLMRRESVRGQDAVINLIGILHGNETAFNRTHAELAEGIAQACLNESVPVLLHMSALHAAPDAPSMYLRSKGAGVERVHALACEHLRVTSFHPSVIFGAEDNFLNQFATLLRYSPGIMLLPGAKARFAPVYVGDVADAFVRALETSQTSQTSERMNLCGPKDYSLQELVNLTAEWSGYKRLILPMPNIMARMAASMMQILPNPPLSNDNLDSMKVDSVCASTEARQPTPLENVAPGYLKH
ncbi:MAG: complex I NDUFA9 subunit family protein [Halothiobacillaceae bacterium]